MTNQLIISLAAFLLLSVTSNHAELIISGPPIGNPSVSDTHMTVTGKLANISSQFSGQGEVGEYIEYGSGSYFSFDLDIRPKDCCVFDEDGKEPELKVATSTVTYTFSPQIKLPHWSERSIYGGTACPSADAEWVRVYNQIKAHEYLHSDAAKSVLTMANVKSCFSGIQDDTGNCVPIDEYDDYEESFAQLKIESLRSADASLQAELDQEQASVDIQHPPGLIIIDTSKDCP